MHERYKVFGIKTLCGLFGKTRHAYYDRVWSEAIWSKTRNDIISIVELIRKRLPRMGTRKLHYKIEATLVNNNANVGRDTLHEILKEAGMTVKVKRRFRPKTTDSNHGFRKRLNLICELVPSRPNEVWVADITYISLRDCFCFLTLITDAYSRMIVGYNLSLRMTAEQSIIALQMALDSLIEKPISLIHHSDKGGQFAGDDYIGILEDNGIEPSQTQQGDPKENAIAERVNGILKDEHGLNQEFATLELAWTAVHEAVQVYNHERPHGSIDYLVPAQAHKMYGAIPRRWKHWHQRNGRQNEKA
jgi:putative transposase